MIKMNQFVVLMLMLMMQQFQLKLVIQNYFVIFVQLVQVDGL
ncbi:unnamed protein product [Schistosoma mattheei]|uniref:Uncharacterized protein n=1 Tax=Schistosoma mattheei TaxID=31246 RepID=A0A183PVT1_9TREM|nr:unnamed protein product [Schistosoma mattheei]